MRTHTDQTSGIAYDLAVGRESYGMQVLLFFPRGDGEVLKALLAADTRLEAQAELDAMSGDDVQACLERAMPWAAAGFSG